MKVYDIVIAASVDTKIKVIINLYGAVFETTAYRNNFFDYEELLEKQVTDLNIVDDTLVLVAR